jgi:hypothetical protein
VKISVVEAIIQTSLIFWYGLFVFQTSLLYQEGKALKAVVEKVSLRLAIMQRLVGPKHQVKTI